MLKSLSPASAAEREFEREQRCVNAIAKTWAERELEYER
jgi:hypothetical protein